MSLTIDTVVAFALRDRTVMDALGEALRSDLVVANPFLRTIAETADDFLAKYNKLPGGGDWEVHVDSLPHATQAGTRETLQRLWAVNLNGHEPTHFAEKVLPTLKLAATRTALSRLNSLPQDQVPPEAFATLTERIESIGVRSVSGLARLADVDVWAAPGREEDLLPTGYAQLDRTIGGWGKELWMLLADAKAGKTTWLQNAATSLALRGSRVLHVSLELSLRPQIHRYYRQIAQRERGEFVRDLPGVKRDLRHWLRLAQGEILLLELPAYGTTVDELRRIVSQVNRLAGDVDVLVLDYLDLVSPPKDGRGRGRYEDLGKVTHGVRAFCPAFDLTVLTATQAVRKSEQAGRLSQRDMGDSYEKVRGADGVLSLIQTAEEALVHQGRLGVILARDSPSKTEFPVYINRELSIIAEESHPNVRALMARLGHLPVPAPAPKLVP